MNDAAYPAKIIENLTRAIAGCLTPDTLEAVARDILDNATYPMSEDLRTFASRMAEERKVLVG